MIYGLRLFNEGAQGEMTILSVSWAPGVYREFADLTEAWNYCRRGVTSVSETSYFDVEQGEDHLVATTDILLPDSPLLDGEQTITLFSGGRTAHLRLYLSYNGSYEKGLGWSVIPLELTIDE